MKKGIIKSGIIGIAISVILVFLQGVLQQETTKGVMKILCDSFFSVGVFMMCIGAISFCSQEGFFDIFEYSFHLVASTFRKVSNRQYKTYADYKEAKHPDSKIEFPPTIISGAILTAVGLLFLLLFFRF